MKNENKEIKNENKEIKNENKEIKNENKEIKNEIVKVIGRISKKGNEYFQTAINVEGEQDNKFIPVFLKKGVEKLNFTSMEKKVDRRGVAYTLYEVPARNVFFPKEENGEIAKAIVTR